MFEPQLRRAWKILFVTLLLAGAWPNGVPARDLLQAVPEQALVVVHIADAAKLREAWGATPLAGFYRDPAAAKFLAPLHARLAELPQELGAPGLQMDALLATARGDVCLVALPGDFKSDNPLTWVLLAELPADSPLRPLLAQPPTGKGNQVQVQQVASKTPGGQDYTVIKVIREEVAKASKKKKKKKHGEEGPDLSLNGVAGVTPAMRQFTDEYGRWSSPELVVLAEGRGRPIESVLDTLQGAGAQRLTASAGWKAVQSDGKAAPFEVFINLRGLAPWFERQLTKEWGKLPVGLMASELKLAEFQAARVSFSHAQGCGNVRVMVSAPAPHTGLSDLLFMGGAAPQAAAGVPMQAQYYSAQRMPLDKLFDQTLALLGRAAPAWLTLWQLQWQSFEQATGISVRRELVGNLGDQFVSEAVPVGSGPEARLTRTWRLAVREREPVRRALDAALKYFAQMYGSYSVEAGQFGAANDKTAGWVLREATRGQAKAGEPLAYLALSPQWLLISPEREGVEAGLATAAGEPNLAGRPSFRTAMQLLTAERSGETFADLPGLYDALSLLLPEKKKKNDGWVDPRAMPSSAVFQHYFAPAAAERVLKGDLWQWRLAIPPASKPE
jgi:hypothetical protein